MTNGLLTWANLLVNLYEVSDTISNNLKWLGWSAEATGNFSIHKAPPPSPMAPVEFQQALERTRNRIDTLQIPPFHARLPDMGLVPTNSFDSTRNAIRGRISDLLDCIAEFSDAQSAIGYLTTFESNLDKQIEMLYSLSQVMFSLAETYTLPMVVQTLFFEAKDVEFTYLPFARGTLEKLKTKRGSAQATMSARLSDVSNAAIEIRNVLTVEAIDLRTAVERLKQLDVEVEKLQEAVKKAIETRDEAKAYLQRQQVLRDEAKKILTQSEERLSSKQSGVTSIRDRIQKLTEEANIPYICPINNVSWNECINVNHVQYKNAYTQNQKLLREELAKLRENLTVAQESLDSATNDVKAAKIELASYEANLKNATNHLKTSEARLRDVKQLLMDKVVFVQEEKHRLRADIFASENNSDQNKIRDVIAQLEATP